jgi:branched-chain amino acid transport system ATP-binding protein
MSVSNTRVLDVRDLDAGYRSTSVVRKLTLHVDAGEVVALMGPNGAGKTTTLLTISGLLPPIGGTVEVLGRSISGRPSYQLTREGLAHVPEDRALFPELTVKEHLRIAGARSKTDAEQAFEYFPALRALTARRAGLLSGGEQQMLALGRALATAPKVLLVDELSMGLAPMVVERLLTSLRDIAQRSGCGILLVEQHVHLALQVADRGYILSHGDLTFSGPAADLRGDTGLIHASYMGTRA